MNSLYEVYDKRTGQGHRRGTADEMAAVARSANRRAGADQYGVRQVRR